MRCDWLKYENYPENHQLDHHRTLLEGRKEVAYQHMVALVHLSGNHGDRHRRSHQTCSCTLDYSDRNWDPASTRLRLQGQRYQMTAYQIRTLYEWSQTERYTTYSWKLPSLIGYILWKYGFTLWADNGENMKVVQIVYAGPTNLCQHSTTDLVRGIMTNERKQSMQSTVRSFKHS